MSDDTAADAEVRPDRLPDVWASRDFPVLRELARRLDESARPVMVRDLNVADLDADQVQSALHALRRRGLIAIGDSKSMGPRNGQVLMVTDVAGEAYSMTGLHPGGEDALLALIETLRQAADTTDDADDRSRLQRAAESFAGMGKGVGSAVLTAYLTHQLGI